MFNAPKDFKEIQEALKKLEEIIPIPINAQKTSMEAIEAPGVLDSKTKTLLAIGAVAYFRCEDCIALHVRKAVQLGISKQEILEAASVALSFGGGPTMAFIGLRILPAVEEYEEQIANGTLQLNSDAGLF